MLMEAKRYLVGDSCVKVKLSETLIAYLYQPVYRSFEEKTKTV